MNNYLINSLLYMWVSTLINDGDLGKSIQRFYYVDYRVKADECFSFFLPKIEAWIESNVNFRYQTATHENDRNTKPRTLENFVWYIPFSFRNKILMTQYSGNK